MFSRFSIRRPVTTIMLTLIVIIAGVLSYTTLDMELMPNTDVPIALVSTTYVGAGPEEIENLVTEPIENALATVNNVDTIISVSSSNSSMVMVQLVDGTDIDMAAIDLTDAIDQMVSSLPDGANEPMVLKMDMNAIPIYLGAESENLDLNELNELLEDEIAPRLERIDGVASVSLQGGVEREIRITVDPVKLSGYGLTTSSISQVLAAENMNMPSGSLTQGNTDVSIRIMGELTSVDEIRNLLITTGTGALIQLGDVAEVAEVEQDRSSFTYINGDQGILLSVDKESTANLVAVSEDLQKEIAKLSASYPEVELTVLSDTSDYIQTSLSNVTQTAFLSAIIAFFVLLLFLKNPITSGIIAVSIPTSILATFALMYLRGMSLNIISMGGVAIGIGMLVDNSVVVLDNIYQYYERGYSPKEAAEIGSKEVTTAIFASTLTTIAVFLPISFVAGTVGQMMQNLSYTVIFALSCSFIVAITFVPMACALLLQANRKSKLRKNRKFARAMLRWEIILDRVNHFYDKVLKWALAHHKKTVITVLLIFVLSLVSIPLAGMDFMESMDEGSASISIDVPNGTDLDTTEEMVIEVLYRIQNIPEVETVYAMGGGSSLMGSSTSVNLLLCDMDDRDRSTEEVCDEVEELLSDIAGAEITVSASSMAMGSYGGTGVTFNVYGDDNEGLMEVESDLIKLLEGTAGITEVEGSTGDTVPEARVVIDRSRASQYGITTASIASALSTAISGSTATTYKMDGTELDVVIRYDTNEINYLTDLEDLTVTSATGTQVPLSNVANIVMDESSVSISREDQKNYISITAEAGALSTNDAKRIIDSALSAYIFPDGYTYEYSGITEMMNESFADLGLCMVIAVLLVYMIMASQFESLRGPFIVMFSMPLAITGAILGLFITGHSITVTSMMGFIMLIGMVVNNGIVLIDYTNQLMERGYSCHDALTTAGPRRLRPILMTTLTTVLGMVPMALSMSEGSEMMQGMAISVIFGLIFSTVITLVFIPVLYEWMNTRKENRAAKRAEKKAKREEYFKQA